jgi:ribosomal protein L13
MNIEFWINRLFVVLCSKERKKMSSARFAYPVWHLVDAKHKICGRLATQLVHILRGKHKPNYCPWWDCGDYVVVINAKYIKFTGDKLTQKHYVWHTGYPGGMKTRSVRDQLIHKPEEVSSLYFLLLRN